jgi:hypothetical protein
MELNTVRGGHTRIQQKKVDVITAFRTQGISLRKINESTPTIDIISLSCAVYS